MTKLFSEEDKNKIEFLNTIQRHLTNDGVAIICDNFLPDYKNDTERDISVNLYYYELEKYYKI